LCWSRWNTCSLCIGLLKLIPGIGSIAGGVIAATTAAALTTAFGEAYIAALEMLFVHNNGEPPTPEEVARLQEEVLATCCRKIKITHSASELTL